MSERSENKKSTGGKAPSGKKPKVVELSGSQRKFLRGLGHGLNPMLQIGKEGLSDGVFRQLEKLLLDHELVKIKILQNAPTAREDVVNWIGDRQLAALVQQVGKTFLLYAPHPEEPVLVLPKVRRPTSKD